MAEVEVTVVIIEPFINTITSITINIIVTIIIVVITDTMVIVIARKDDYEYIK